MPDFPARFRNAVGSGAMLVDGDGSECATDSFARSVADGLAYRPKWLHCRFLYDAEGSRLFEQITQQPEYYPTRTEAALLARYAEEIRDLTGPCTVVELGSGYSVKTEHLLSAYSQGVPRVRYVPVDVSVSALRAAGESIEENFDAVQFTGIYGTYSSAFPVFRQLSPLLVVFLGSTLGNFNGAEDAAFWRSVAGHLPAGDHFLLGVDLVKDPEVLEAAYNDAAGITAQFTRNYCSRLNRELGAGIDVSSVEHVAVWNPRLERMEMSLRFATAQELYIEPLDASYDVAAGEQILIEISRKFRLPKLINELAGYGLRVRRAFTDEKEWFALLLFERNDSRVRTASSA